MHYSLFFFFFSSRRRHTRLQGDWSSDVCSSDLIRLRGRQVFKAGEEMRLTRKEFDLLVFLVEHRGEVITRERLLDEGWGVERFPTTRTVDTHILRLRRKFEADPDHPVPIPPRPRPGYK